jgi:AsmA protein
VTGRITIPEVSPRKLLPSLGVELPQTSDPAVLSRFLLESDYRLTETAMSLSGMSLVLDDTRVKGSAAVEDLEKMALTFDLAVDAINVDRYLEPEAEDKGQSSTEQAEPTELPVDMLRELNARGKLRIGRATFTGLEFTDLYLPLTAKGGLVHLGPTRARLFGGAYEGDIRLDVRPAQARLSLNERVKGIDVGALMKAAFDTDRVVGRGDASAVLTATGNTDAALFKSLAGKVDIDVKEGAITGVDLWYELRRARALLEREPIPPRAGPERTAFTTFRGSATLENGVMRNDDLRIEMDYLKSRGAGTLDLSGKTVDYRLVAQIYEVPREGAGHELADLKALEIPISITGRLDDMKVRPDLQSVVKARVRQEVTEKVQEKTEELKKKLSDKLKDLLGR